MEYGEYGDTSRILIETINRGSVPGIPGIHKIILSMVFAG